MKPSAPNSPQATAADYPSRIPAEIPDGFGLVAPIKFVRPVAKALAGFASRWSSPSDHLVPCDCGWAPEAGVHYRVSANPERGAT